MSKLKLPTFTENTPITFSLTLAGTIILMIWSGGSAWRGIKADISETSIETARVDRAAIERDRVATERMNRVVTFFKDSLKDQGVKMDKQNDILLQILLENRKANDSYEKPSSYPSSRRGR